MSSQNIQVVEAFMEAMKSFDFNRVHEMLTEDAVYQNVPLPADHGRDAVERTLKRFTYAVDYFDVKMHHIAERGNVVLTERTDILRGKYVDMEFWVCGTFEVRDGKIALWRDRFDVATAVTQFLLGPVRSVLRKSGGG